MIQDNCLVHSMFIQGSGSFPSLISWSFGNRIQLNEIFDSLMIQWKQNYKQYQQENASKVMNVELESLETGWLLKQENVLV